MEKNSHIVEMSKEQFDSFKKYLKEQKKPLNEVLLTIGRFNNYKIESFEAAKKYSYGSKWTLSINEEAFNNYIKDYDYYIIHLDSKYSFAILTTKNTYHPCEIRDKTMQRYNEQEFLYIYNDGLEPNKRYTMKQILENAKAKGN